LLGYGTQRGEYELNFPKAICCDIWDDGKGASEFAIVDNTKADFTIVRIARTLKVDADQLTRDQVVVCQLIHNGWHTLRIGLR